MKLVEKRGEPGYLTQIDINLPQVNATPLTSVDFTFYLPRTRKQLSVGYVNTDLSISAEQMEMARRAGVADVMMKAQDAALAPQISERAPAGTRFCSNDTSELKNWTSRGLSSRAPRWVNSRRSH